MNEDKVTFDSLEGIPFSVGIDQKAIVRLAAGIAIAGVVIVLFAAIVRKLTK